MEEIQPTLAKEMVAEEAEAEVLEEEDHFGITTAGHNVSLVEGLAILFGSASIGLTKAFSV